MFGIINTSVVEDVANLLPACDCTSHLNAPHSSKYLNQAAELEYVNHYNIILVGFASPLKVMIKIKT